MNLQTPVQKAKAKKMKEDGCRHVYEIEVPAQRVQEAIENAIVRVQNQARIAGFRKGKAPLALVRQMYGDAARSDAADQIIKDAVAETVRELGLRPVSMPAVDNVRLEGSSPLRFELHLDVAPTFTAKGYKGIEVSKTERAATDAEVEQRLKALQEGNARLERVETDGVGKDHYLVIDYELSQDGAAVPNGQGKGELVDMSSDQTVDGLAAGLLGAKRGEPREFDVKLDGKPARCKATVHEIKRKVLPSIDDDFAKDLGVGSLGELRTELRKIIQNEHEEKSRREVALQIEKALLKTNAFPAPKSLAEHRLSDMMERIRLRLVGRERELPEKQAAEIREKLLPEAEDQVRLQFILAEIARQEKIEVTEDDVKAELERSLERTQDEEGRKGTREFFEKNADEIRAAIREAKVLKLIRDAAEVKTVKG